MRELIGTFPTKDYGQVRAFKATYGAPDGPTAVLLEADDGEPLATLSVNMYKPECSQDSKDLPKGCFYVKNWSENEALALEAGESGLFEYRADLPWAYSGYVQAPVWQIVEVPK